MSSSNLIFASLIAIAACSAPAPQLAQTGQMATPGELRTNAVGIGAGSEALSSPDWASITPLSKKGCGSDPELTLRAVADAQALWVLVESKTAGAQYNLYLNTHPADSTALFANSDWKNARANWLLQNGVLMGYRGDGSTWAWDTMTGTRITPTQSQTPRASTLEFQIPLGVLRADPTRDPVDLGFEWLNTNQTENPRVPANPGFARLVPEGSAAYDAANCRAAIAGDELPDPECTTPTISPDVHKGVIIPAYWEKKSPAWAVLEQSAIAAQRTSAADRVDFWVAINGNDNGPPGRGTDSSVSDNDPWPELADWNQLEHAKLFGYVHACLDKDMCKKTAQFRPIDSVMQDIARWKAGLKGRLAGIWIDEFYPQFELTDDISGQNFQPNRLQDGALSPRDRCFVGADGRFIPGIQVHPAGGYFEQLTRWIRQTYPDLLLIGNTGGRLFSNMNEYANLVDVVVSFEQSQAIATNPGPDTLQKPLPGVRGGQLVLFHTTPEARDMQSLVKTSFDLGYTHVYVTDVDYDGGRGNTWGRIPSYWTSELPAIFPGAELISTPADVLPMRIADAEEGETFSSDGFTLHYDDASAALPAELAANLQNTFFAAIAQESAFFNPNCPHEINMRIVPNLKCNGDAVPACALGDTMQIDSQHLLDSPEDYDLVTHEAMHLVQAYPALNEDCGYWVEGLADLARYWYGVNNAAAGWQLTRGASYTDSYTVTAGFLDWLYESYGDGPILGMDRSLREGRCPTPAFWQQYTESDVDSLWSAYAGDGN